MRYILLLLALIGCGQNICNGQSFYAVLVADTKDPELGPSCEKDLTQMSAALKNIAAKINFRYTEIICSQDQFGKAGIENALSGLQCTPKDIILFYYTGHGISSPADQTRFPILRLNEQQVSLESIHTKLKEKKAGFCLTFGDCCNNLLSEAGTPRRANPVFRGIGVSKDGEILQKLFVQSKGDLILSSARKGERATANPDAGSFYSENWVQALSYAQHNNAHITWEALLRDAENRLQETLKFLPDSLRHHSQWQPNVTEQALPCAGAGFNEVNRFLNLMADENVRFNERNQLRVTGQKQLFSSSAQVAIYMNDPAKPVETQPIDQFLKRVVNTAPLIGQFNFVERLSDISADCLYNRITLQEVRTGR